MSSVDVHLSREVAVFSTSIREDYVSLSVVGDGLDTTLFLSHEQLEELRLHIGSIDKALRAPITTNNDELHALTASALFRAELEASKGQAVSAVYDRRKRVVEVDEGSAIAQFEVAREDEEWLSASL